MAKRFRFARNQIRWGLLIVVCVFLVPYIWSRVASRSRRIQIRSHSVATSSADHQSLRIASYNIAHGRGLPFVNWNGEDQETRSQRLDDIARILQEMDADIVALNEVDFDSSWSHNLNQAEYLAKKAGYAYWVEERNLDFRIVNYTWRFGNAILSRYPITHARTVSLPSYEQWETLLAGKKRAVFAVIELDSDALVRAPEVGVVSAHLSHRSEEVRSSSAEMLCELAANANLPVFIAGDLNSSPEGFPKSSTTDTGMNAIQTFDASGLFQRHPMSVPEPEQMTFPADEAEQVIDWILIPKSFQMLRYQVVDTQLSDHRPVCIEVRE